jgi:hypothetical protein
MRYFYIIIITTCFTLSSNASDMLSVHKKCLDLGFKEKTTELANCKLEILLLEKKTILEEKQIKAAEAQAEAARATAAASEASAKAQRSLANTAASNRAQEQSDRGLRSLSGDCSLLKGNC